MRTDRYCPLKDLLEHLPADGRWTVAARDQWLGVFTSVLDLVAHVEEPERAVVEPNGGER